MKRYIDRKRAALSEVKNEKVAALYINNNVFNNNYLNIYGASLWYDRRAVVVSVANSINSKILKDKLRDPHTANKIFNVVQNIFRELSYDILTNIYGVPFIRWFDRSASIWRYKWVVNIDRYKVFITTPTTKYDPYSIEIMSSIKDKLHLYTANDGEETFATKIFQQVVDRIICGIPYNKTKKHFITLDILYRELEKLDGNSRFRRKK